MYYCKTHLTIDHNSTEFSFFSLDCNKMKWMVLQMLMFYITKNKSLSDDFILEQFEQHSERIRRLEELCTGGLTDGDLSRELRWQKADQEDSRATKTHKVKFDFQCTPLGLSDFPESWRKKLFENPDLGRHP